MRPPGEPVLDFVGQVHHIAARAVQILPSHWPVPDVHSFGPHAAEDTVRIPHESLPGRMRIKHGGLECPTRRVEEILQFQI